MAHCHWNVHSISLGLTWGKGRVGSSWLRGYWMQLERCEGLARLSIPIRGSTSLNSVRMVVITTALIREKKGIPIKGGFVLGTSAASCQHYFLSCLLYNRAYSCLVALGSFPSFMVATPASCVFMPVCSLLAAWEECTHPGPQVLLGKDTGTSTY